MDDFNKLLKQDMILRNMKNFFKEQRVSKLNCI